MKIGNNEVGPAHTGNPKNALTLDNVNKALDLIFPIKEDEDCQDWVNKIL